MKPLDNAAIAELLKPVQISPTRTSNQKGPLKWYDVEMRCASRGCSSPTYCRIDNIPKCFAHALEELNQIVLNLESHGIRRVYSNNSDNSDNSNKGGIGLDDLPGQL